MGILSTWQNDEISITPCNCCGGKVIEYTIPNDIWNKVIRTEGRERDDEYLCIDCFFNALRVALAIVPMPTIDALETRIAKLESMLVDDGK